MTRDRPLIRLAVGIASVATVAVLAPMAKAGNYERAQALTNQWVEECAAPKAREYQSYGEAILAHRPATPVPPMSAYCNRLYEGLRKVNPYGPVTPPESWEQAFAKSAYLQDKYLKDCGHALADLLSELSDGRTPRDTEAQKKYCDLLYDDLQQANDNFEIAKQNSDELYRLLLQQEQQR